MKRKCVDEDCSKTYVTTRLEHQTKREFATVKGDERLCNQCFNEVKQIEYEQSYFGSIKEWGA